MNEPPGPSYYLEAARASIKDDLNESSPCPAPYHERKQVFLIVQYQYETDQTN